MATVLLKGEQQELFSGVLFKCGGKVKSWNKRFFILKSDYCLYYYKDTSKGALGVISLRDPKFEVRKGEAGDVSWPRQTKLDCTMAIVTLRRTFCAYSMYSHEIEEWIHMLTNAREKVIAQGIHENKLLSGGRSASSSQIEQSKQDNLAGDKTRPLSMGERPENYESMYDEPNTVSRDQKDDTVYEPQQPEAVYALASPEEPEEQVFYEDVLPNQNPVIPEEAVSTSGEVYEEMSPQHEDEPTTGQASSQSGGQPLYDDITTDIAQPLYEDIAPQHSSASYVAEEEQAQNDDTSPSLPSSADFPPLPPRREVSPPLPPRNNSDNMQHGADSSPPSTSHPTQNPVTPSRHHPSTPPNYDIPKPILVEATPADEPSSTDGLHEVALTPDDKEEQKKPSPVPRRRSFSPQQQAEQNQQPLAKPRSHHGTYNNHYYSWHRDMMHSTCM